MREGDKLLHKERRGNRRIKNRIYIHEDAKTSMENSAGMIAVTQEYGEA